MGSLRRAKGSSGFAWVHSGAPRGHWVHSGGFTQGLLAAVAFIRVCVVSFGRIMGSSGLFGFSRVHLGGPRGRRVRSGSRGFSLGVVGFIRVCLGSLRRA